VPGVADDGCSAGRTRPGPGGGAARRGSARGPGTRDAASQRLSGSRSPVGDGDIALQPHPAGRADNCAELDNLHTTTVTTALFVSHPYSAIRREALPSARHGLQFAQLTGWRAISQAATACPAERATSSGSSTPPAAAKAPRNDTSRECRAAEGGTARTQETRGRPAHHRRQGQPWLTAEGHRRRLTHLRPRAEGQGRPRPGHRQKLTIKTGKNAGHLQQQRWPHPALHRWRQGHPHRHHRQHGPPATSRRRGRLRPTSACHPPPPARPVPCNTPPIR
jgi:hypothetical protein